MFARTINGQITNFVWNLYMDHLMLIITQIGTVGAVISGRCVPAYLKWWDPSPGACARPRGLQQGATLDVAYCSMSSAYEKGSFSSLACSCRCETCPGQRVARLARV